MSTVRISIGLLAALVFLLCAVGNGMLVLRWYFRRKHGSLIPLLGGLSGVVAFTLLPVQTLNSVWWAPLVLDFGSAPLLLTTLAFSFARISRQLASSGDPDDYE